MFEKQLLTNDKFFEGSFETSVSFIYRYTLDVWQATHHGTVS